MIDVICDLDGVLYRGETPIEGTPEALERLIDSGARVTYVTNNSTRSPARAAEHIGSLIGVATEASQVITSSQAAASMLGGSDWPAMAVGEEGVSAALSEKGGSITTDPGVANSVIVGMHWGISYDIIADAADAVRDGARFVATNSDPTYPTADRLLPGAGAVVAAIATTAGRQPEIAGKPNAPIRTLLRSRGIQKAWVVGDRLDTDVALARAEPDWTSVLVLTGVTGRDQDLSQADQVVADFPAAVDLVLGSTV